MSGQRQPASIGALPSDGTAPPTVTTFGKYSLFASLGKGGMADVFLSVARGQMGFNKLAVIKRLRPALAEEVAFRTMFLDEARLAARLNHPNIVHTYEVGEHNGQYFIAMEYLEGQALNKVQKELVRTKQRLPAEIAVRIIADGLAGLSHAHELRDYDGTPLSIIHRDVSPHNLFCTYDGHTKLVDFGIAKAASSSTETEVGILKGKVAYMSPEQAMGATKIDQRSDLFAMGIVLWELLTQQRLMTGDNPANTLHKLMNEIIPHVADHAPGIDMDLDHLVMHALEKDPARRFQTAQEMRTALEGWLARQPHPARQEDVAQTMNGLFGHVRGDVQKEVQKQMAFFNSAANTAELHALTQDALARMGQPGGSGGLMKLGGSGSGSGVIASYGGANPASNPPSFASMPPSPSSMPSMPHSYANVTGPYQPPQSQPHLLAPPPKSSSALLLVITAGCFALAVALVVVFGFRGRLPVVQPQPVVPSATESAAATADPPPTTTSTPTIAVPTVIVGDNAPAPAPRPHPNTSTHPVAPPKTATPTTAPASDDAGFVTLSAYPWAKVSEGGKVVCQATPCNRVSMSPGAHTLTFENGVDPSQKQTVAVNVKSGETTPKNIGFK